MSDIVQLFFCLLLFSVFHTLQFTLTPGSGGEPVLNEGQMATLAPNVYSVTCQLLTFGTLAL